MGLFFVLSQLSVIFTLRFDTAISHYKICACVPVNAKPKPLLNTNDLISKRSHICLTKHRGMGRSGGTKLKKLKHS